MSDGAFAPIDNRKSAEPAKANDEWHAVIPVPDDAPPAPAAHYKRGVASKAWAYRDHAGKLLGYIWRFDLGPGEKDFLPLTWCENASTGKTEWRFKSWEPPRPLYGLDLLAQRHGVPVMVVEGEKAADAARQLLPEFVVVTSPGGAKAAAKADWSPLRDRDVVIWPDADAAGRGYAMAVAKVLK